MDGSLDGTNPSSPDQELQEWSTPRQIDLPPGLVQPVRDYINAAPNQATRRDSAVPRDTFRETRGVH